MYPSQAAAPSRRARQAGKRDPGEEQAHDDRDERARERNAKLGAGGRGPVPNSATPPNSGRAIESTSMPSRRATNEWPRWEPGRRQEQEINDSLRLRSCMPSERPGFSDGKTQCTSDQTMRAKTAIKDQWSRTSIPPKRPNREVPVDRPSFRARGKAVSS